MVTYDRTRLRLAVQLLVDSSYAHHHIKRLRSTVPRPRSLPFSKEVEVLNELLIVGRQNLSAMEALIELAESKRDTKNDYQRDYMATKRRRDRKVLQLEELMVGAAIPHTQQLSVLQHQYSVWKREKDTLLASLGNSSWHDRNEKLREFWQTKEGELDALIEEAKVRGPVRRRKVIHIKRQPKSDFGQKLASALDRR